MLAQAVLSRPRRGLAGLTTPRQSKDVATVFGQVRLLTPHAWHGIAVRGSPDLG